MQLVTRPKLLPPLALLTQASGSALRHQAPALRSNLSTMELRRIVADLIG